MSSADSEYTIVVAVDSVRTSGRAINHAFYLASKLGTPYRLIVLHAVALNRPQGLPYIDNLDKASNIDIKAQAKQTVAQIHDYIRRFDGKVDYEIKTVEAQGNVGPVIEAYIVENYPRLDLLITGTRNHQGLKKLMLGSTSEYFVHHLSCPVTIVKEAE
ncbi:hypothetical protein THASP1DRAFT_27729 [Thamnocephalis sphaerospora]|uniref:UspA domain-containing protein n=1 Tax=Thamnocephalis sphaerospora TaxID=78915 RepID=A0A4P9XXT6_9FUNG|nr:hypothetical protein THASP1DRAFT_27729 [Thamnocephalis sphaerospora]|eukprot:RKP10491.1 hypothetical protein THASP1DRAFT_27729 [Thamnocephalis sphaerospora]